MLVDPLGGVVPRCPGYNGQPVSVTHGISSIVPSSGLTLRKFHLTSIVDLTPGSISIAIDRLVAKGLVSRVESAEDRRVRIVALSQRGKGLIVPAFRKHSGQMRKVFSELSPEELRGLELALKKIGKHAAALMQES
jgi:DNA-binding PadR family transcriptional regulator